MTFVSKAQPQSLIILDWYLPRAYVNAEEELIYIYEHNCYHIFTVIQNFLKFKSFSLVYLNNQFDSWEPYGWRRWQVYNLRLIIYQEFNERLIN